jgi:hypothetical protein
MFVLIDTKGANHIAINVPHEGADKTLPALAAMFEQNAVFINKSYGSIETVTPAMSIQLGNRVEFESYGQELAVLPVPKDGNVIDESFVLATPEVYVSYKKALKQKDTEIERLRTELAHTKQQLQDLQDRINAAADDAAD